VAAIGTAGHDRRLGQDAPVHPLDNPVWHAINAVSGPQRTLAEGGPLAARFDLEVAPFSALPDEPTAEAWRALQVLAGAAGVAVLFGDPGPRPPGWTELFRVPTVQLVATSVDGPGPEAGDVDGLAVRRLGATDVPEMLDLVARTQPGPFAARTIELGEYLGVRERGGEREGGPLVAMAGVRLRLPGYSEISAVCTDPAHRERGLARALVLRLVAGIEARGETAMLHATKENVGAIRLYLDLGFTLRRDHDVVGLRWVGVVDGTGG
jgi:ribosomal protein S18 acetylase RimI-like enzyme